MSAMHDFSASLAYSHSMSDRPWWETVYRKAFPDMRCMVDLRHQGWHQKAGRDRAVVLSTGRTLYVDEKVRDRPNGGDIAVEVWSVYPKTGTRPYVTTRGAVEGWAVKALDCDYIAYAWEPSAHCILLPTFTLRRAVLDNLERYHRNAQAGAPGYRYIEAQNSTWKTVSIAVPTDDLLKHINNALKVTW